MSSEKTSKGICFQSRDFDLLRSLFESRTMTAAHIAELHFNGKDEATKKRLQKLKAAGLIGERRLRVSDPAALFLTAKGLKLLKTQGIHFDYPKLDGPALEKRARVSEFTLRHELEVMDVKAAFHRAVRRLSGFKIAEFVTWPVLYQFEAFRSSGGREILVKPDGFIRVQENESDGGLSEHSFFLEVDRSSEVLDTLVNRASCYLAYYKSGGFAESCGGTPEEFKGFPFRVLMVFKTAERRNNVAERLLQLSPPIFTQVCLTTLDEVIGNPLGSIWIRPLEYREATKGTRFDPDREMKTWGYKRQTEREFLIQERSRKVSLFL